MDFEILPPSKKRPSLGIEGHRIPFEKKAAMTERLKQREQIEKQNAENVAEKIISNLENIGIKCPRCGLKNTRYDRTKEMFYCLDCKHEWKEHVL